jgi:D-alanyl-D-alanine carboxypeptidase
MTLNSEYLLDQTVYGSASGNYDGSSQLFYGNPVRAANYYGGQGAIQTATIRITGFVGVITLEATLNDQPSIQAAWSEVGTYGNGVDPDTDNYPLTITGNFTFMRVRVNGFDAGTINSIILTY